MYIPQTVMDYAEFCAEQRLALQIADDVLNMPEFDDLYESEAELTRGLVTHFDEVL